VNIKLTSVLDIRYVLQVWPYNHIRTFCMILGWLEKDEIVSVM